MNTAPKRIAYRKLALSHYAKICAVCGFGIEAILEIAHLDHNRENNDLKNLVVLCPTCHKMHDVDIISTEMVKELRDRTRKVDWSRRMKDAGKKAAATRKANESKDTLKWHLAGLKAVETRKQNAKMSPPI